MSLPTASSATFKSILDAALESYVKQTGVDIIKHPSAERFQNCLSPEDVILLLSEGETAFKDYRDKYRKMIDHLRPVVRIVYAFSGTLGAAFPQTKVMFLGIDVLLSVRISHFCLSYLWMTLVQAAIGITTSYDALLDVFECVSNFLKRLNIYTERIPLSPTMSEIVVKIIAEIIAVLALTTKQIKQGRLSKWATTFRASLAERITEKFAKKLLGESDIEAILQRLDRLTQEEARVTAANALEVVHRLFNNLKVVMDGARALFEVLLND